MPQNQQDSLTRLGSGPSGPQFKFGRPDYSFQMLGKRFVCPGNTRSAVNIPFYGLGHLNVVPFQ